MLSTGAVVKGESTKNAIIQIVGQEGQLNAKSIHRKLIQDIVQNG